MARKRKNKSKPVDGFVMLPRWFFESKIISSREKFFCLVLAYHRNSQNKQCNPGVPLIGLEANLCERTIKTYRKKLIKLGIISYTPGTDKKNRAKYKLNWLDGSGEEIMRLKKLFASHQLVQKNTRLTSSIVAPVTSAKEQGELVLIELERKKQHHQKKKPDDDVSLLNLLQPKTLSTLRNKIFRLGKQTIIRLLATTEKEDVNTYFSEWIEHIMSNPEVRDPGPYFVTVIREGSEAPPTLELAKRVELFNDLTGKEMRAENSTAFESRLEREILESTKREIVNINKQWSCDAKIRNYEKIGLIHKIYSVIKPSRLKKFRTRLPKLEPGNPDFRQIIAKGYEFHTKNPYSELLIHERNLKIV